MQGYNGLQERGKYRLLSTERTDSDRLNSAFVKIWRGKWIAVLLLATLTALAGTSAQEHSAMLGIAYRAAHSLTGAARCVELADLAQGCAKVEFVLRQLTQSDRGTTSAQLQQLFAA